MSEENKQTRTQVKHKKRHWFAWAISIILIVIIAVGGYEYYKFTSATNNMLASHNTKSDKKVNDGKPVSILLMGVDTGALGRNSKTYGKGNTDTLELMTVNADKKTITMTSIPRDTLVKIDSSQGTTYSKINAAFSIGGVKKTEEVVSELLDTPVDYYAMVNMGMLRKVINAIGGVTIKSPLTFSYGGYSFTKGKKQHLNGKAALAYSRMRYDDPNNDYGRQKRQQQIINAIIKKIKSSGSIGVVNKLLDVSKNDIRTDAPIDNALGLYNTYKKSMKHVKMYHLQGENSDIDGSSVQIASPKEINRLSKINRNALDLTTSDKVINAESKLYDDQENYNQYTNDHFKLPDGFKLNVPKMGF